MCLKDKVAIITGAGSGIDRSSAILFAKEGAIVVVADYDLDKGSETVELVRSQGREAVVIQADVTVPENTCCLI